MASSLSRTSRHRVFTSFHGPDVRQTFLSHLHKLFDYNGISMFDDQGIDRSHVITHILTRAIRESRISIVLLSERYASSSWCLDELLEILKCRKGIGQIVMTVYYGVDPSDVRNQTGDFGMAFNKMCAGKTNEERRNWSQALKAVGNIAGEDSQIWDSDAKMIEKITKDVLDKLNATSSRDFDGMVGLEDHLTEMKSLLDFDNMDEAMIVGITGSAGIGKTTIARALQSQLSYRFHLTCFVDNLRGSFHSGLDEYSLKLRLQEEFLSKILKHDGIRISDLHAIQENLCDQKVLIILDDVNHTNQLEALVNESTWFGRGSRIVVTTEDKELLQQHGIGITYHVGFPSHEQALKILCNYAFKQSSPPNEFKELAESILDLCGNLPLRLREVGSSLFGKDKDEWDDVKHSLESSLSGDPQGAVRIGSAPSSSNTRIGKSKSWCSTGMDFLVVVNLLFEITSMAADQLSTSQKPNFARISLVMSGLSVVLSILDFTYKIRTHRACFRCKWPIPWFYYPSPNDNISFGNFTDTVLLFCVTGQLTVSTINWYFIERRHDGPIKVSLYPLVIAIGMVWLKFKENAMEKTPLLPP